MLAWQITTFWPFKRGDKRQAYRFLRANDFPVPRPIFDPGSRQPTYNFDRLHQLLLDAWLPIMNRLGPLPTWEAFHARFGHLIRHVKCDLDPLDATRLHAIASKWFSGSGDALGWTRPEFRKFPLAAFVPIADLLNKCEEVGHFPDQVHVAPVALLPKVKATFANESALKADGEPVNPAPTALQQRPITLQALIVSLWSTCRFRDMRPWFSTVAHPTCYGGLPGRSTKQVIWSLYARLDAAMLDNLPFVGLSVDCEKYFDSLIWDIVFPLAEAFGMPPKIVSLLKNYLGKVRRYFKYYGTCGPTWTCTNSVIQGCAISLILVALQTSVWAAAVLEKAPEVAPTSYVDDKQVTGTDIAQVAQAICVTKEFMDATGERGHPTKSGLIATSKDDDMALREAIETNGTTYFESTPRLSNERVLGAPSRSLSYRGR